jgi:hypothetical protein
MQPDLRQSFNRQFSPEKYQEYMRELDRLHPGALDFRNAETPLFIPRAFKNQLLEACEHIIDIIKKPDFLSLTENAVPHGLRVPDENPYPDFLVFDFGICENQSGEPEPRLIEMQGFPSLFAYQAHHARITAKYARVPENYDAYLNAYDEQRYFETLRNIIVAEEDPEEVILLEIYPEQQKTRIDFYCTGKALGIATVCLTELTEEGNELYYIRQGKKKRVRRIYNRLITDDLQNYPELPPTIDLRKGHDVTWVSHPNWFYRVSKYTLPLIEHPFVPATFYLDRLNTLPHDLENYVLKPLFSFAGQGVMIDIDRKDVECITDPANWILQQKVKYADIIATPDGPAKAEIRIFYFWEKGRPRPEAVLNLARLSKGKMIGTRYNKDKTWVGGSVAFFER